MEYQVEMEDDGEIVVLPADVARLKARTWWEKWQRQKERRSLLEREISLLEQSVREAAEEEIDAQKYTVEDIDRALATMKTSSGMGGDWWDVAALRMAPVGAKEQLAEMMTKWRRQGLLPIQLMYNIVKLIPKPGGGERPIALMPMLVRLYFRLGKGEEQEWLDAKVKHYDKAVKGSSAVQAALGVLFKDELAAGKGEARVSVLWDLEKFFDNIALDVLIRRAMQFGYPAEAVACECALLSRSQDVGVAGRYGGLEDAQLIHLCGMCSGL